MLGISPVASTMVDSTPISQGPPSNSERRTSLPDIDLDVESERRLEVYNAIIKRFGKERTAVTGMPETSPPIFHSAAAHGTRTHS
ncbi:hypothetical protein ABZT06_41420 [Streptomyces sp. NPDC005483]|uniref:hypothetical protein n=1 Tax=Streptomyces sp. NPDC005483 TaxID=3154882 RepID=UPI0033B17E34